MCSKKLLMKCKPTCGRWRVAGRSSPALATETAESIHLVSTSSSVGTRWWKTLVDILERRERPWGFRVYKQNPNREGKVAVSDVIRSDSSLVLSQRAVFSVILPSNEWSLDATQYDDILHYSVLQQFGEGLYLHVNVSVHKTSSYTCGLSLL